MTRQKTDLKNGRTGAVFLQWNLRKEKIQEKLTEMLELWDDPAENSRQGLFYFILLECYHLDCEFTNSSNIYRATVTLGMVNKIECPPS